MAVKGYTREQMKEVMHKRRIRAFYIVITLMALLAVLNVVFTLVSIGALAFATLLIFLFLFVIYVRGVDALDEEGHNPKVFKLIKWILLIVFIITFTIAVLSM